MDLLSNDFNDFQETQTNEEIFKEDMAQFETSMILNSIQSFENKKKKEFQKSPNQPYFDLMTLFQLQIYNKPESPIEIPDSEFHTQTPKKGNKIRLEDKIV